MISFEEAVRVALSFDIQLEKAISLFPEAKKLLTRRLELEKEKPPK